MSSRDLQSHMTLLFNLSYFNHYDLNTLEDLPVWELELYRDMVVTTEEKIRKAQQGI